MFSNETKDFLDSIGVDQTKYKELTRLIFNDYNRVNSYKIRVNYPYKINKGQVKDFTFYNITLKGKNYDGKPKVATKPVKFVGCEPPEEDGQMIVITKLYEDFYFSKSAKQPVWCINVLEYNLLENEVFEKEQEKEAFSEYNQVLSDDDFEDLLNIF